MTRIILIAAQSLDGFITRHDEPGTGFCSPEDAAFFKDALKGFDSLVMGSGTFDTMRDLILNSPSTRYLRKIVTRSPERYAELEQPDRVEFTASDPAALLEELTRRGRQRCALLGGSEIYSQFLASDLVDELWLTLEPRIFGNGTPLARGSLNNRYALHDSSRLNSDTLLLKYRR